jgi:hypothetical protein
MEQYRQGDVLLERVSAPPDGVVEVSARAGRLVLAEGEATGHAHTVDEQYGVLLEKDGVLYLSVTEAVPLEHQEHAAIPLKRGTYRVTRQREWGDNDEPRPVLD